jgi:hypothetical protein
MVKRTTKCYSFTNFSRLFNNYKAKQSRYTPRRRLGERRYSSYSFLSSALDGGVINVTPRPRFAPRKGPRVPIVQEAGWAPEPVWTQIRQFTCGSVAVLKVNSAPTRYRHVVPKLPEAVMFLVSTAFRPVLSSTQPPYRVKGRGGRRGRPMAKVVSRRPPTAEAWVRARVNPCGICVGQSGTGTGFSPSSSIFPCQYHSTVALQTHII